MAVLGAAGIVAVAALATAATVPTAQAAPVSVDPLARALGYNAFVENETVLASTESEGGIATGGNLVIAGSYNVNIHDASSFTAPGDTEPSALVVGGRIDFAQDPATSVVQVHDYVKVGDLNGARVLNEDANNASVNTHVVAAGTGYDSTPRIQLNMQQPISSVGPTSPIDFEAAFTELRANAADLYACDAHEVVMKDDQGATVPKGQVQQNQQIRIALKKGVTNILSVTGEDLNAMADLVFLDRPSTYTPLLINVDTSSTGDEFDWKVATQAGISGPQAPYILWNFNETARLRIASGDSVEGSILAPYADYSDISPTNVEGQIIARNASLGEVGENGGEIHHFPFQAELTCDDDVDPTANGSTDAPTTGDVTTLPSGDTTTGTGSSGPDGSNGSDGAHGSGGDGNLAATGGDMRAFIITAAVLVAVGAVALIAAARRRAGE
ncbi:choice-of-anchor A family protein [Glycomyces tritici]|uniref:Choice-of-anchor A family protein n=1 Tax=Glycomyces tritici TaxID=2665176 RepID=A0ABT7YYK3_9ACTN|nr:choice-of-anchor A family protein [Glycomyces tritici]MDN3243732.1 choice-of-anchor A family protein [Glycomyces tritici]